MDHDRYIKEVPPVAFKFGNDMFGTDWTFQQDRARAHIHRNDVLSTFLASSARTIGPPNSPDLNPLDYSISDELAHQINWDVVTSKTTFISELKRAVRKVSPDVAFESCSSWTSRLYQLSQGKEMFLI